MTTDISDDAPPSSFLIRHRVVVLILLGALLYIPSLGLRDFWYPDEPDIGEVVKVMVETGDWVAPRRMGEIWVDYPPLLYWAGAISAHLTGGVSEFAFRLPNALTAIALVVMVCLVGTRWFDPRTGFWAGFVLLTVQQFVLQAVGFRPDLLFALCIAGGMFAYSTGAGSRPRWILRVAGFALLGLAMLAKGPLGLLLPGLVLFLWHGSRREWRRLFELAPLALVSLAVYMPWFVACAHAMGSDSIIYELYTQNVARFFAGARGHAKPIHYYLVTVWRDLYPWAPLLPFAIWWGWRNRRFSEGHEKLLLWWMGAFVVFLSFAVTKRQIYLLPAYPAMALLLAPWLAGIGRRMNGATGVTPSPRPLRIYGWCVAGFLVVLGGAVLTAIGPAFQSLVEVGDLFPAEILSAHQLRLPLGLAGLLMMASAVWIAIGVRGPRPRTVAWRIGLGHSAIYLVLLVWCLPAANPARTYRPAGEWMLEHMGNATHFGMVHPEGNLAFRKMGGFGYHTGRLVELLEQPQEVRAFFERHPGSIVLVHGSATADLFAADETGWQSTVIRDDFYAGGWQYLVLGSAPAPKLEAPSSESTPPQE